MKKVISRAENPSARATAQASSAWTHTNKYVLSRNRLLKLKFRLYLPTPAHKLKKLALILHLWFHELFRKFKVFNLRKIKEYLMKCSFRNCLTPLCNGTTRQLYLLLLYTISYFCGVAKYKRLRNFKAMILLLYTKILWLQSNYDFGYIEGQNHICKFHVFSKVHKNLSRVEKCLFFSLP